MNKETIYSEELFQNFSYKYSRSGGVFFAFRSRCRGFHVCFDVLVSFISSSRAISGRLLLNADIAVWIASSFNSVLVGIDGGGNGSECSYGNSDVGCHATNNVQSSVDTTFSTWPNCPTAVVKVMSADFDRYSIRLITPFWRNFVKFLPIFSRNAAIFPVHTPEFGDRSEKKINTTNCRYVIWQMSSAKHEFHRCDILSIIENCANEWVYSSLMAGNILTFRQMAPLISNFQMKIDRKSHLYWICIVYVKRNYRWLHSRFGANEFSSNRVYWWLVRHIWSLCHVSDIKGLNFVFLFIFTVLSFLVWPIMFSPEKGNLDNNIEFWVLYVKISVNFYLRRLIWDESSVTKLI